MKSTRWICRNRGMLCGSKKLSAEKLQRKRNAPGWSAPAGIWPPTSETEKFNAQTTRGSVEQRQEPPSRNCRPSWSQSSAEQDQWLQARPKSRSRLTVLRIGRVARRFRHGHAGSLRQSRSVMGSLADDPPCRKNSSSPLKTRWATTVN